jgi:hypothetical protein
MILIFDSITGTTEQIRNLRFFVYFSKKYNLQFSIRYASCRSLDLKKVTLYDFKNLFNDEKMFENTESYIPYDSIKNKITSENCVDFYKNYEIEKYFWRYDYKDNYYKEKTLDLINVIKSSSYEYIILGPSFHWWYYDIDKPKQYLLELINDQLTLTWKDKNDNDSEESILVIPSEKIMNKFELFKKRINNSKYNFIHYRYEDDYNHDFITSGNHYIVPMIDDLIEHVPFKEKLPIYIATSSIELLHKKGLMKYPLENYSEIIYKNDCADLFFDEAGFLDYLIGIYSEEVYGFSKSGLSSELIFIKKYKNMSEKRYDNLAIFNHEKYFKKI